VNEKSPIKQNPESSRRIVPGSLRASWAGTEEGGREGMTTSITPELEILKKEKL